MSNIGPIHARADESETSRNIGAVQTIPDPGGGVNIAVLEHHRRLMMGCVLWLAALLTIG